MTNQDRSPHNYNRYICETFAQEDEVLHQIPDVMKREGVPAIHVSASEGKTLQVLALISGAKRILEIGTLSGYSAIWMARALPEDGKLISLELDPHHANVARHNIELAGLADSVEVRVGPAADLLLEMAKQGEEPFDMVFIDADKGGYVEYLEKTIGLVRDGGLILADNTLPDAVLHPAGTAGAKHYNTAVAEHSELVTTLVPMLRDIEGIDGLTISIKKSVAR